MSRRSKALAKLPGPKYGEWERMKEAVAGGGAVAFCLLAFLFDGERSLSPPPMKKTHQPSTPPTPSPHHTHTGLIGMLPSLWEKDFHRVVTRWANAHGPVFKMRIMQFHVSV